MVPIQITHKVMGHVESYSFGVDHIKYVVIGKKVKNDFKIRELKLNI